MANNKPLHCFLGTVLILVGAWFGFIMAKVSFNLMRNPGHFSNPWLIGDQVLRIGLAAFCVWIGTREFQRATGQEVKEPGFRWGRMLAGIFLVFSSLKSHYSPRPNALKADNDTQAAGMLMGTVLMTLVGMLMVAYSVKPRKPQPVEAISQSNSDQVENARVP